MNLQNTHGFNKQSIFETDDISVTRIKNSEGPSFIYRQLNINRPTTTDLSRFYTEYDQIKNLSSEGLLKVVDIRSGLNDITIIHEDFQGEPVSNVLKTCRFDQSSILSLAIKLSQALETLHAHDVIHGNITPRNILINCDKTNVKLSGYGIDHLITRPRSIQYDKDFVLNSLPYQSPEQTGRMNRSIDYRSDFYSLGITLFEMTTGILPFRSRDPLELIHCHIAWPPVNPCMLLPELPDVICRIFMKLMAKAPEERYQSASGLKADLMECDSRLRSTGSILPFTIGKNDFPLKFIFPQKVYGRDTEINVILNSFENVCRGKNEIILVSGPPGIGKSSLVNEIHKPVATMHGYFISGKYEPYKNDTPYSAIVQSFQSLIRQKLSEDQKSIAIFRKKLYETLGQSLGVLTDIFPELELIIGKQPKLVLTGPEEKRNRLNVCLETFISELTSDSRPLVIFLDDLQWVDYSSINLLMHLVNSTMIERLMLILSYRDVSADLSPPLHEIIRKLEIVSPPLFYSHSVRFHPGISVPSFLIS